MIKNSRQFKAQDGTTIYFIAVVALLFCQIIAFFILESAKNISDTSKETLQTALAIIFQISNLSVFFAYNFIYKTKPNYFLKPKNNNINSLSILFGVLLGILCLFFFMGIAQSAQNLLKFLDYKLSDPYVNGIIIQDIFLLINTVIFAPLGEELIFRSALLSGLKKRLGDITCALLVGFAFALFHLNPEQTVYQFFLGFGAAILALSTGWVIPSIIMHLVSNLIVALGMINVPGFSHFFKWYFKTFSGSTIGIIIISIVFPILGITVFIFISKYLKSKQNDSDEIVEEYDNTILKTPFYKKYSFLFIYFVGIFICLLLWCVLLFQNIM